MQLEWPGQKTGCDSITLFLKLLQLLNQNHDLWVWNVALCYSLGAMYPVCRSFTCFPHSDIQYTSSLNYSGISHPIPNSIICPALHNHVDWSTIMKNSIFYCTCLKCCFVVSITFLPPFSYHSTFYLSLFIHLTNLLPTHSSLVLLHPVLTVPRQQCQYSISSARRLQPG